MVMIREPRAKAMKTGSLVLTGEQSYHNLLKNVGCLHQESGSFPTEHSVLRITQEAV